MPQITPAFRFSIIICSLISSLSWGGVVEGPSSAKCFDTFACETTEAGVRAQKECLFQELIGKNTGGQKGLLEKNSEALNLEFRQVLAQLELCRAFDKKLQESSCFDGWIQFLRSNSSIEGPAEDISQKGGLGFDIPIGKYYEKHANELKLVKFSPSTLEKMSVANTGDPHSIDSAIEAIQADLGNDRNVVKDSVSVVAARSRLISSLDDPQTKAYFYVHYREKAPPLDKFLIVSLNDPSNFEFNSSIERTQISMVSVNPELRETYFGNFTRSGPHGQGHIDQKYVVQRCMQCHISGGPMKVLPSEVFGSNRANALDTLKRMNRRVTELGSLGDVPRKFTSVPDYNVPPPKVKLGSEFPDPQSFQAFLNRTNCFSDDDAKEQLRNLIRRERKKPELQVSDDQLKERFGRMMNCASCHDGRTRGVLSHSIIGDLNIYKSFIETGRMPIQHGKNETPILQDNFEEIDLKGSLSKCLEAKYLEDLKQFLLETNSSCLPQPKPSISDILIKKIQGWLPWKSGTSSQSSAGSAK